ncbi:MAG TPA: tetratricopeptide repeat protein, partial [Bacteroidetes bacterium]|nr:tetratricopeptide repeat protein [Bacteroidota bacterium]
WERSDLGYFDQAKLAFSLARDASERAGDRITWYQAMNGIAGCYLLRGEYLEVIELAQVVDTTLAGEEEAEILIEKYQFLQTLGSALGGRGNFSLQIELQEKVVAGLGKLGQKGKALRLKFWAELGLVYAQVGAFPIAKAYMDSASAMLAKLPASAKEKGLEVYSALANYHLSTGNLLGYIEFGQKGLKTALEQHGKWYYAIPTLLMELGVGQMYLGNWELADALIAETTALLAAKGSQEKVVLANCYSNLFYICKKNGNSEMQRDYLDKCHDLMLKVVGEEGPGMEFVYNNYSNYYSGIGDYEVSQKYLLKVVAIFLKRGGGGQRNLAQVYENIGTNYLTGEKYEEAMIFYEKSLQIRLNLLGPKHLETGNIYTYLGVVYLNLGDSQKSEDYFAQALQIILGEKGAMNSLQDWYRGKGLAYLAVEKYDKALESLEMAVEVAKEMQMEKPAYLSQAYSVLGKGLLLAGRYEMGLEACQKGLDLISGSQPDLGGALNLSIVKGKMREILIIY